MKGASTGCYSVHEMYAMWSNDDWVYDSKGKREVCKMMMDCLKESGISRLRFLSMPANGREVKCLMANGFSFDFDDCVAVEREKKGADNLKGLFSLLHYNREMDGVIPVRCGNIDDLIMSGHTLSMPKFNFIHFDYNGPLVGSHVEAVELSMRRNRKAVVAVTVQAGNAHGLRMNYNSGDFPFDKISPDMAFYRQYKGVGGKIMETYCFRAREDEG